MAVGRVFKRSWKQPDGTIKESPNYSIAFWFRGRERVESAKTNSETKARAFLRRRLEEIGRGEFSPNQDRVYLSDLRELLKAHYKRNNHRSVADAVRKSAPVVEYFKTWRVRAITYDAISAYVDDRLERVEIATVNGELRYLRQMFRLGIKHRKIATMPIVELLEGENRRRGFIDPADFAVLLGKFEDPDVRDLVDWLYRTGWRVSAGRGLEWRDVDFKDRCVIMRPELSKNKEPLALPFSAGIEDLIERRRVLRRLDCPYVFHRKGRQIKDFREEWTKATDAAKRKGLLVHDLCRSAARNLSRAGVPETVGSQFMNRKTLAIYKLYRVVDTEDLRLAGRALEGYLQSASKTAKVTSVQGDHTQTSDRDGAGQASGSSK